MPRVVARVVAFGLFLAIAPLGSAREEASSDGSTPEWKAQEFDASNVLVLTTANFTTAIAAHHNVLAMFHAPWCAYCQALAPIWAQAADALVSSGAAARLALVDAIAEEELSRAQGVDTYPFIQWYSGDEPPVQYRGDRSADDIFDFVRSRLRPSSTLVETQTRKGWGRNAADAKAEGSSWAAAQVASLDEQSRGGGVALGLMPRDGARRKEITSGYLRIGAEAKFATFYHTTDRDFFVGALATLEESHLGCERATTASASASASDSGVGAVLLLVRRPEPIPHDEKACAFLPAEEKASGGSKAAQKAFEARLARFVGTYELPPLVEFNEAVASTLLFSPIRHLIFAAGASEQLASTRLRYALRDLADQLRGTLHVVMMDVDKVESDGMRALFGMGDRPSPASEGREATTGLVEFFGLYSGKHPDHGEGDKDEAGETVYAAPVKPLDADSIDSVALIAALTAFGESIVDGTAAVLAPAEDGRGECQAGQN